MILHRNKSMENTGGMQILKVIFLLLITTIFSNASYSQYQNNIEVSSKNFHDLNIALINDGSNDHIAASNLFNGTMQSFDLTLKRIDQLGAVVWIKEYAGTTLQNVRVFDVVSYVDLIFITGSVDVNGTKTVFVAKIDATSGNILGSMYYDIVAPSTHTTGLKIITTEADIDGDAVPDPGLLISGFFSDCYSIDPTCNNIGFLFRTDNSMNLIWTIELDTSISNKVQDYDFINGITETSDGYFLTGSVTAPTVSNSNQQTVLAYKVDFLGNFLWDMNYEFGNSNDVSVDAFYDAPTDEIYMLSNYSVSHYFGITVLDNATGTVNPAKTWYATGNDFNRYGFELFESVANSNNLIVSGYDRDENWVDPNNNSITGQSNLFVHEFSKADGSPAGITYQYLVEHTEPVGDEYNFWNGQMPLIYYPDISLYKDLNSGIGVYEHIGYRTLPSIGATEAMSVQTLLDRRNECDNIDYAINPMTASRVLTPALSGATPNTATSFALVGTSISTTLRDCTQGLATSENSIYDYSIYPNPVADIIRFDLEGIKAYEIYDVLGKKVLQNNLETQNNIDVSNLSKGIYSINLINEEGKIFTNRFIKK